MQALFTAAIRSNAHGNRIVFEALQSTAGEPANALAAFQHVLEAELIWLLRMEGQNSSRIQLWTPEPSLERCSAWLDELDTLSEALIARLSDDLLAGTFSYARQNGEPQSNRFDETLFHMLLHSAQYRGEAMGFINATGVQVPDTDFIHFLRTYARPASA